MSSSAFTPTVLTISSSSQATGEKNYISATDSNVTGAWLTGGSGVTVATSTTNLPDNITRTSSIGFTRASGSTGYGYVRFTLDQADYGKKFKIQWDQIYGGVAGDFQLRVFSNTASDYSGTSTQLTVATAAIAAITGTFTTSVDISGSAAPSPYIEVRIVSNGVVSASTTLYLAGILIGPGTISQGAAISEWQSYTPTLNNIGSATFTTSTWKYKRVGSDIEISGYLLINASGSGASNVNIPLPSGLTINTSAISQGASSDRGVYGYGQYKINGLGYNLAAPIYFSTSAFEIHLEDGSGVGIIITGAKLLNQDELWVTARFPCAEWSGSGTVNLGPGAQVEYAWNSSATTTSDTTSFAAGPSGVLITAMAPAGVNSIIKRVKFQYPIQDDDVITLEVFNAVKWEPMSESLGAHFNNGTTGWGQITRPVSGSNTDVDVFFFSAASSNTSWSTLAGLNWKWRVRKAKASAPVGSSVATPDGSAGLYKPGLAPGYVGGAAIPAGYIGQLVQEITNANGGTDTVPFNSETNVRVMTLPAGVWSITGHCRMRTNTYTSPVRVIVAISTTSSTLPTIAPFPRTDLHVAGANDCGGSPGSYVVNIAANTTYYLVVYLGASAGAGTNAVGSASLTAVRIA
jgi:hypothetical protein